MKLNMLRNSLIYTPYNAKLIITNTKNSLYKKLFILIDNKKFIFVFKNKFFLNKWGNSVVIIKNKQNNHQNKINREFYKFICSWNLYFYNKIKFKGKGFRIKFLKKNKLIKFYFGRSHKTFFLLKKIKKKRINKYKFLLYGLNNQKLLNLSKNIIKIKNINFYTLRGLRLSRQIIFKRKGKKGTYI